MTWQILVAASAAAIPDSDLSIEVAELAFANAELVPRTCSSEAEVERAGAIADGLLTVGIGLGRQTLAALSRCRAIISQPRLRPHRRRDGAWHPRGKHVLLPR